MSRIDMINQYGSDKAKADANKERDLQVEKKRLMSEIRELFPRMIELIDEGNACVENGIPIVGQRWGGHEGYDTHQFCTNGWSHLVGFVQNPCRKETIAEIGMEGGGACTWKDLVVDPYADIIVLSASNAMCEVNALKRFLGKFDEFETEFHKYVDSVVGK